MIVIDASALIAVVLEEEDDKVFADAIAAASKRLVSAPTVLEGHYVAYGRLGHLGSDLLDRLLRFTEVEIVPFDRELLLAGVAARQQFGKGTGHRANLNIGDCFSYALAKTRDLPLLFKGDDFVHTDVVSALEAR